MPVVRENSTVALAVQVSLPLLLPLLPVLLLRQCIPTLNCVERKSFSICQSVYVCVLRIGLQYFPFRITWPARCRLSPVSRF